MEIRLQNFRCWGEKTVTFSPEGITLLHGRSGRGKSSILEAIAFAIIGKGRNIVSAGKSSCTVTLILIDGTMVIRKKRPNTVIVKIPGGDTLEDDAAQGYLDSLFTSTFDSVSYLRQGQKNKSFILMSPGEKLVFLEELAFRGYDIIKLKTDASDLHKKRERLLISTSSKMELLAQQLKGLPGSTKKKFPIRCSDKIQARQEMVDGITKFEKLCEKTEQKLALKMEELQKTKISEAKIEQLRVSIEETNTSMYEEECPPKHDQDRLIYVERVLSYLSKNRQIASMVNTLESKRSDLVKTKEEEIRTIEKRISDLSRELWDSGDETEALEEIQSRQADYETHKEFEHLTKRLNRIKIGDDSVDVVRNELERIENSLISLKKRLKNSEDSSRVHTCPECKAILKLSGDIKPVLTKIADCKVVSTKEISTLEKEIALTTTSYKSISHNLSRLELANEELEKINKQVSLLDVDEDTTSEQILEEQENWRGYIKDNKKKKEELTRIQTKINNRDFSDTVLRLETDVKSLQKRIKKAESSLDSIEKEKATEGVLTTERELLISMKCKEENWTTKNQLFLQRIESLQRKLSFIKIPTKTSDKLNSEAQGLKVKMKTCKEKLTKLRSVVTKIDAYFESMQIQRQVTSIKKSQEDYTAKEGVFQRETKGAAKLKNKIKEAESDCLAVFTNSLQTAVQLYLDEFFPTDPISIRISRFKKIKTKKITKPEIHVSFSYKGQEFDYSSLSGGELQRVILAFTLALSDKFSAPFIMLDEATSNLDQNLTNIVVSGIKKYHPRPVILVAHQVVTGVFESVVEI